MRDVKWCRWWSLLEVYLTAIRLIFQDGKCSLPLSGKMTCRHCCSVAEKASVRLHQTVVLECRARAVAHGAYGCW